MLFYYVAGVWNNEEGPHTGADRPTGSLECHVLAETVGLPSHISKTAIATVCDGGPHPSRGPLYLLGYLQIDCPRAPNCCVSIVSEE